MEQADRVGGIWIAIAAFLSDVSKYMLTLHADGGIQNGVKNSPLVLKVVVPSRLGHTRAGHDLPDMSTGSTPFRQKVPLLPPTAYP